VDEQYTTDSNQVTEQITGLTENKNDNTVEITHDEHEPGEYIKLVHINVTSEMSSSNR